MIVLDRKTMIGSRSMLNKEKVGDYQTCAVKGVKLTLVPTIDLIKIEEGQMGGVLLDILKYEE